MFGGVDMARAEQHGKGRHRDGDKQRNVAGHARRFPGARSDLRQYGAERCRHRLELERDVGNRSRDGDHGDRRRNRLVLAVAGGDEVGDRGDVLTLRQPHHANEQRRRKPDQQDRP
jgi:hypothetical protein